MYILIHINTSSLYVYIYHMIIRQNIFSHNIFIYTSQLHTHIHIYSSIYRHTKWQQFVGPHNMHVSLQKSPTKTWLFLSTISQMPIYQTLNEQIPANFLLNTSKAPHHHPYSYYSLKSDMGWLRLAGSFKLQVSFAEYRLFYRPLLQKRLMILWSLLIVATPYLT